MKKTFTLFLMVVSLMTLGVVSSCKDYNEDLYNDFNRTISDETTTIWEHIHNHCDSLKIVDTKIQKLHQDFLDSMLAIHDSLCRCDPKQILQEHLNDPKFKAQVESIIKNAGYFNSSTFDPNDPNYDATTIQAISNAVMGEFFGSQGGGQGTQGGSSNTFQTNIENIINQYLMGEDSKGKADLDSIINAYIDSKEFTTCVVDCATKIKALEEADSTIKEQIATLDSIMRSEYDTLTFQIQEVVEKLVKVDAAIASVEKSLESVNTRMDNFDSQLTAISEKLESALTLHGSDVADLKKSIAACYAKMKEDSLWVRSFVTSEIEAALDDAMKNVKKDIDDALYYATCYTDQMIANLSFDKPEDCITKEDLKNAIAASEAKMQEEIKKLNTRLKTVEDNVQTLSDKVDAITGRANAAYERLNAQITSIEIQGVTNPLMFDASIALPVGVESNILAAYYGDGVSNKDFPDYGSITMADGTVVAGDAMDDWKFASGAGKVYFTINPSTIDFTGTKLRLVDSRDNESSIILENVKKSNKLLQFGVSRAASNGFYEADAVIAPNRSGSQNSFNISKSELKAVAKDLKTLLTQRTGVKDLAIGTAKLIYHASQLPAYGLAAPYSWNETIDGVKVTHTANVYSKYDIAAVAVKPLSYNFDLQAATHKLPHKHIKTITRISDLLSNTLVKVDTLMYFKFRNPNFKFDGFNTSIEIKFGEISIKEVELKNKNVEFDINASVNTTVKDEINLDVKTDVEIPLDGITVPVPIHYTYSIPKFNEDGTPVLSADGKLEYEDKVVDLVVDAKFPDGTTVNGSTTSTASGEINTPVQGDVTGTVTGEIPMEDIADQINKQIIEQVANEINKQLASVNDQLEQINDMMASVNKLNDELNKQLKNLLDLTADDINGRISQVMDIIKDLAGQGDGYIDRLNGFIGRVNSLLDRVYDRLDNANYYLQPVLMAGLSTSGVSAVSNLPTTVRATSAGANYTNLYPTSYTAEVINPAFKKYIVVVAARDAKGVNHPDAVAFANKQTGMNQVIDGRTRSVVFGTDSKYAGLTYDIVYAALDYHGYQSTQHYYIKVIK